MTKEEYKKNLVRMFDSLRTQYYEGAENCVGITCDNCPFGEKVCNKGKVIFYSFEAIEIVENWAKEHPVKTNSEKFKEVFGFDMTICWDDNPSCDGCPFYDGIGRCYSKEKFWDAEYNEKTKE